MLFARAVIRPLIGGLSKPPAVQAIRPVIGVLSKPPPRISTLWSSLSFARHRGLLAHEETCLTSAVPEGPGMLGGVCKGADRHCWAATRQCTKRCSAVQRAWGILSDPKLVCGKSRLTEARIPPYMCTLSDFKLVGGMICLPEA
eukprot:364546-Chlamydomonas_euryale.AAC.4